MWNIWQFFTLFSSLPPVQPCCLPRQMQFDMITSGYEEFDGERFNYTETRTFYYDEDRNCTFIKSGPDSLQLDILTDYSAGVEYMVSDTSICEMRVIPNKFDRMCLPDNAVFQREMITGNGSRVHVFEADMSESSGVLKREYGVVYSGDNCYFLWWKDEGDMRDLDGWKIAPESYTFRNIRTQISDNSVFDVPEECPQS